MTRWADPEAVQAAADEWSDRVVHCRIYGHGWSPSSVTRHDAGFIVQQRCKRCTNIRQQEMDSRGYAYAWKYVYSDGYLSENLGRINADGRAVLRLTAIRHLTILEPEKDE